MVGDGGTPNRLERGAWAVKGGPSSEGAPPSREGHGRTCAAPSAAPPATAAAGAAAAAAAAPATAAAVPGGVAPAVSSAATEPARGGEEPRGAGAAWEGLRGMGPAAPAVDAVRLVSLQHGLNSTGRRQSPGECYRLADSHAASHEHNKRNWAGSSCISTISSFHLSHGDFYSVVKLLMSGPHKAEVIASSRHLGREAAVAGGEAAGDAARVLLPLLPPDVALLTSPCTTPPHRRQCGDSCATQRSSDGEAANIRSAPCFYTHSGQAFECASAARTNKTAERLGVLGQHATHRAWRRGSRVTLGRGARTTSWRACSRAPRCDSSACDPNAAHDMTARAAGLHATSPQNLTC